MCTGFGGGEKRLGCDTVQVLTIVSEGHFSVGLCEVME